MQLAAKHSANINRDIAVNFAARFATLGATYLFIPFYVRILGLDNYALIALYFVILTFAALADAGLSATIAREAAREADRLTFFRKVVTAERLLFAMFAVMGGAVAFAAPLIVQDWLSFPDPVQRDHAVDALRLMGASLVFQQCMGLYIGALMGLRRQVTANAVQLSYILVRAGLVIPLIMWTPDIRLFFLWQLGANLAFMVMARIVLLRAIRQPVWSVGVADLDALRPSLGFAGGMFATSIVAVVNTQMDRVVISAMLPIRDFSSFSLAASAAQLPYIVLVPFTAAMLPRLTSAFGKGDSGVALGIFLPVAYLSTSLSALASGALVFFAPELMTLWLGSEQVSPAMLVTVRIMAIGGLALAAGALPFYVGVANGYTRASLVLAMCVVPISLLLLLAGVSMYGMVGAAFPWVISNSLYFAGLSFIIHRRFLPDMSGKQFLLITALPVAIGFMVMAVARLLADQAGTGGLFAIALAGLAGLAGLGLVWRTRILINSTLRDVNDNHR